MKKNIFKIFQISIVILTIFSVQLWLSIPVTSTFITWAVDFYIIYIILHLLKSTYICKWDRELIALYFAWMLFSTIRGAFVAENYWEWKQLISGVLTLSLPILVYAFDKPVIVTHILRFWFKYALIIFVLFIPFLSKGAYHFYLGPLFLTGCFIPLLPKKWKYIIGGLLMIMLFIDLGARSQVIKSAIVLLIALSVCFRRFISNKIFRIVHWICYIFPIMLLYLGISGTFNALEDLSSNKGRYIQKRVVDGQVVEEDLSADTRTFIYEEVITSAIRHNYVIWGRTPARGNDSMLFGKYTAEELKTGKYERHSNEVCHPNVFTWLGLIGVVLYSLIYLRSSYLAVYKSNNIYIKYLGCFIAFRWAYGWVEDINRFDIANIALWMMIAMGISIRFRSMNNREFSCWIRAIFINTDQIHQLYNRFKLRITKTSH